MRRVLFSLAHTLAILCLAMNTLAMPAEGASPNRNVRRPSYGVYVKTTTPDGKISYRYAYRGMSPIFRRRRFCTTAIRAADTRMEWVFDDHCAANRPEASPGRPILGSRWLA